MRVLILGLLCTLYVTGQNPEPVMGVGGGGGVGGSGATSLDGLTDVAVGSSPPGTCTDDHLYLDTSEATPADRLKICDSNVWYKVAELTAGDYIDIAGRTISLSTVVPIYSSGAGAPSGVCTAGREFYLNTTTTDLYRCSVSETWPLIPYYTTGSGAPSSGACDAAGEVGRFYARTDNTSGASPLYVCGQTGSGTYGWSQPLTSTGNAATATALAANPTNCSAGNYPLGVDASGNAESCTAASAGGGGVFSYESGITRWLALTGTTGTAQVSSVNVNLGTGSGTPTYITGSNGVPPYRKVPTSAATTDADAFDVVGVNIFSAADDARFIAWVQFEQFTSERQFIGFTQSAAATHQASDTGGAGASFAGFRCSTSIPDTNWQAITKDGTTAGTTDTGVACGSTAHVFDAGTSDGGTTWVFKIDGATVATRTTNVPATTTNMYFVVGTRTLENVLKYVRWSFIQFTHKPW